jgi:5-oxoprolinase (ATP-hydrolysing)
VLGFDMGGTSTDVCRYAGVLERRDAAKVAGVKLRSPMLDVETVAAGGGSILAFDGMRARAGPASAGADPGPACYGRGGPAAVTDANLVLGRLDPRFFPAVFGPRATRPWTRRPAGRGWATWPRPWGLSVEAAAEGFVAVAVEQMAQAVRRISTERGFDPRDHALVAFGGAAGQVACQTAEALGRRGGAVPAIRVSAVGVGNRPGAGDGAQAGGRGGALDAAGDEDCRSDAWRPGDARAGGYGRAGG